MSINSETLKKIKELSDKKDKTKRQEERLKNLKELTFAWGKISSIPSTIENLQKLLVLQRCSSKYLP